MKYQDVVTSSFPKVYLAGSMSTGHKSERQWRDKVYKIYKDCGQQSRCFNPYNFKWEKDKPSSKDIVDFDKALISVSSVVFVNASIPSIGTSMEQLFAYQLGKVVVVYIEESKVLSPWTEHHSHIVFRDLNEAIKYIVGWKY